MFNQYPYINENDLNLDYILKHVKALMARVDNLEEWRRTHEDEYAQLKELYDQIISGNFPPSITEAFYNWCYDNIIDLVGALVKHVFFGLTDNGYFCAFIPDNWSDITFDSIDDGDDPLYGHLVLMYD